MAMLTELHSQWHPGEQAMQHLLGVPGRDNPTVHGLKQAHGHRVMISPLVAFGALDERGRPWATVWGGEAGFCRPIAKDVLGINSIADGRFDPVVQALFAVQHDAAEKAGESSSSNRRIIIDDEVIRPEERKVMAGLSIDLETRDRVKLAGRFIAGAATGTTPGVTNLQMAFAVEEALGNCPKYLNKKHIVPHIPAPELVSSSSSSGTNGGLPLPREAVALIERADLFFIASKHGNGSMDVNHRGGAPGFLRVFRNRESSSSFSRDGTTMVVANNNNDDDNNDGGDDGNDDAGIVVVYPEYSGNRLYQTLGNLRSDPVVGLVVPDFETGDVLYLTGRTTILVAERAAAYMPRAKLAVRIDVAEARFVRDGLPFRGRVVDYSPYNPPVRKLAAEKGTAEVEVEEAANENAIAMATLCTRQIITPTVSRYVFKLKPVDGKGGRRHRLRAWEPGQHVTFDFSAELDHGYAHMRDDDPQSLNDDFVRTFTVSAPLDAGTTVVGAEEEEDRTTAKLLLVRDGAEPELEVVVRRHGPATALLAGWNLHVPLEIPVLGFGGAEEFRMPVVGLSGGGKKATEKESVFVAGGVGITPLLAQAADVLRTSEGEDKDEDGRRKGDDGRLKVLWSLRAEDLALAADVFTRIGGLGPVTRLYVTGSIDEVSEGREILDRVKGQGAVVMGRRIAKDDVLAAGVKGERKFFCCTGPAMMRALLQWMEGEEVAFESFEY